jgi:hypothetical protein
MPALEKFTRSGPNRTERRTFHAILLAPFVVAAAFSFPWQGAVV